MKFEKMQKQLLWMTSQFQQNSHMNNEDENDWKQLIKCLKV